MLNVSQPTVRRRLNELEKHLGVSLFDRMPEGHRLSEPGRRICDQARRLADQVEFTELTARSVKQDAPRRVRVTAAEGISFAILTPVIARMRRQAPNVAIDLVILNKPLDLTRQEADVAIRLGDPKDERLIGQCVGLVEFGLFGSEDYLADAPPLRSVADLANHQIIESTGDIAHLPQAAWLREAAQVTMVGYSANSLLNQMNALAHGLGLLAMPNYLATDMPNIRRVLGNEFSVSLDAWLLTSAQAKDGPGIRPVIDMLATEVRKRLGRMRAIH